jgi:hypothetical protein
VHSKEIDRDGHAKERERQRGQEKGEQKERKQKDLSRSHLHPSLFEIKRFNRQERRKGSRQRQTAMSIEKQRERG